MNNNGRQGELLFRQRMIEAGYSINDVSGDPEYWTKDIDFICTNPTTGASRAFEVKWDTRIANTNNLYLELTNVHSKGGKGWFNFTQADFLAYGDAQAKKFYIIPLDKLRERVEKLPSRMTNCGQDSIGLLINLRDISDITTTI